jgi:mono/diheme cytochrome c family protein
MQEELEERDVPRPSFSAGEFVDLLAYLQADSRGVPGRSLYVLPGRADRGEDLFRGKSCIRCHGPPGAGGRVGPDLSSRARGRSLLEFAAAMWNHQPRMLEEATSREISLPRLEPGEMSDVVAYLYSVRYLPGAGDRRAGAGLVRRKGCLRCHTPGAHPDEGPGDLSRLRGVTSAADVIASMWNHLPLAAERDLPASRWTGFTEEEMADLAAYLESASRQSSPPSGPPR